MLLTLVCREVWLGNRSTTSPGRNADSVAFRTSLSRYPPCAIVSCQLARFAIAQLLEQPPSNGARHEHDRHNQRGMQGRGGRTRRRLLLGARAAVMGRCACGICDVTMSSWYVSERATRAEFRLPRQCLAAARIVSVVGLGLVAARRSL